MRNPSEILYSGKLSNGANFRIIRIGKHRSKYEILEKLICLMGMVKHAHISPLQNGSFSLLQA